MQLKRIIENHNDYFLPKYCFDKKFKQYFFLESSILGGNDETCFFDFLKKLQIKLDDSNIAGNSWTLFCPREHSFIAEELLLNLDLSEVQQLFIQYRKEKSIPFAGLFHLFWMAFEDKIQVYTVWDSEIIIVGVDSKEDIHLDVLINNKNVLEYFYSDFADYVNGYPEHITGVTKAEIPEVISLFTSQ